MATATNYNVKRAINSSGEGADSAEVTATPAMPSTNTPPRNVLCQEDWGRTNGGSRVSVPAN